MKVCAECRRELPLDDFHRETAMPDGRHRMCRACSSARYLIYRQSPSGKAARKAAKQRNKWKKQNMIDAYKAEHGCRHCGIKEPAVLEMHHVDPATKHAEVGTLIKEDCSFATLRAEMDKCIVLCKNCHILAHRNMTSGQATYPN